MPVKRRIGKATTPGRITPACAAAYARGDWHTVHMLCGLQPWHESPLDVTGPEPPGHSDAECWALSWALRVELEAALAQG